MTASQPSRDSGSEPRTEAGRRLAHELGVPYRIALIVAIESAARREGWDAALAAVRAAYGECRDDGSGVCAGHGELLFDGSCEDGPPRFLDQLADGPKP